MSGSQAGWKEDNERLVQLEVCKEVRKEEVKCQKRGVMESGARIKSYLEGVMKSLPRC